MLFVVVGLCKILTFFPRLRTVRVWGVDHMTVNLRTRAISPQRHTITPGHTVAHNNTIHNNTHAMRSGRMKITFFSTATLRDASPVSRETLERDIFPFSFSFHTATVTFERESRRRVISGHFKQLITMTQADPVCVCVRACASDAGISSDARLHKKWWK